MAYLALYRKYRPRTFDDVISQEHITTTLKNQLINGQSSHAYLFTGSRGTGKTTCAKILAKALNCTDLRDGNPCLECDSCKSIDEDYSDITEIDAASNNGVDDVRILKEESFYAPMSGKYKVYIIDEVHMLSTPAFNALLKLIEEPPAHVVFILATTEVHKVPATILSRCQRFEFRRIDINDSKKRLLWVAEQEGRTLTDDAAFLISKISEGGMRDALSLLDQCFSVSDNVTAETVRECAGISGSDYLFRIADMIFDHNTQNILITLDELIGRSKDVVRLCEELISHFRSLMLLKAGADPLVIKVTSDDLSLLRAQSEKFTLNQIMRCISILSDTLTSMGRVRTPALSLEMCFIKLCTPKLDTDEKGISARLDLLEQKMERMSGGVPVQAAIPIPVPSPIPAPEPVAVMPEIAEGSAEEKPAGTFTIDLPDKLKQAENGLTDIKKPEMPKLEEQEEKPDLLSGKKHETPEAPEDLKSAVFGTAAANETEKPAPAPAAEEPVPIPEGEFAPLGVWREIIATLPEHIQLNIENTEAFINDSTVMINGGSLAVQMAVTDYREEIQKAVSRALGRNVVITGQEKSVRNEAPAEDKVKLFLDLARSKGVTIKEK